MLLAGGSRRTFWKRCHFELAPEGSSRVRDTGASSAEGTIGSRKDCTQEEGTMQNDQGAAAAAAEKTVKGGWQPIEVEREIDWS